MGDRVQGTCAGIRVLDLTQGMAGPLATMVLADYGAEVVRVEPPEADLGWNDAPYLLLQRGKKSIELDLASESGRASLHELVRGVDVVVESWGQKRTRSLELDYDTLAGLNPALVYCSINAFGTSGPWADLPADDGIVMAKSGAFRVQPGWDSDRGRPVFRASKDPSYFSAMLVIQAVLAALRARDLTGEGQFLESTLFQALTCRPNAKIRWLLREGEDLPADASTDAAPVQDDANTLAHHRDPRAVSLTSMLVQAKDGRWLMHALTEPHFVPAWIRTIGFDWIWDDERFKGTPHHFADPADKDELIELIRARMKEHTAAEWMELYIADGNVCADIVETTQEALAHPQVVAAGFLAEVDDPRVGRITQIGPIAKIPGAPGDVRGPAPLPGEHTDEVLRAPVEARSLPAPTRSSLAGPLAGITIIEAATYYAVPFATALLADLGARVIKIEAPAGDPYRKLAASNQGGVDAVKGLGHNNMVRALQGKESIALNLKDARGQQILHELVADADIFVHNFRPGVPEALRIDHETIRAINPDIVYHNGTSYGSVGPYARQPAIDPVIAACTGLTAYQAGEGNPPLMETGADPIAAAGHAAAMMLGLFARHRTGQGQLLESAMVLSNLYANCEDALAYDGKPPRPLVDHMQNGTGATYRLYETAPVGPDYGPVPETENANPQWVFLSASRDDDFARFCGVAGRDDLARDARFATADARREHRAELEGVLEALFLTRSAPEWEATMLAAGVGCVMADDQSHFAVLYGEAGQAVHMMARAEHPSFGGTYWRHGPLVAFSRTAADVRPFCEKGEHTRALLTELGYDDDAQARLAEAGVVVPPVEQSQAVPAST